MGASFLSAKIHQGSFSRGLLSWSDFHNADLAQSLFSLSKISRATFQNAKMFQVQMNNAIIESTDFQSIKAIDGNFSQAEMSTCNFQNADISHARMDYATLRTTNFYSARAIQTNFARAYMPDCLFQWATLREASFRSTVSPGSNFENADVQDVDFTLAFLAGARITAGQLDTALSITNATLPDGGIGKNKNLLKNGHAQCTNSTETITDWIISGDISTDGNQANNDCVFQAGEVNATLQQTININRYNRLISNGEGQVYIEMQVQMIDPTNPSVYMILRFFDIGNVQLGTDGE